jgi:hypothetical protein
LYTEQEHIVEAILSGGAKKHVIRKIPTGHTASAILDVIRGIVTQRLLGWSRTTVDQDVDFIFDLIWKGISAS